MKDFSGLPQLHLSPCELCRFFFVSKKVQPFWLFLFFCLVLYEFVFIMFHLYVHVPAAVEVPGHRV